MSAVCPSIEHMFDNELRSVDDSAVVAAIEQWASAEASAAARRLAAVAELARRRCGDDDRADWACDSWDAAAAEVSAALSISHGRASGQIVFHVHFHVMPRNFSDNLKPWRQLKYKDGEAEEVAKAIKAKLI